MFMVAVTLSLGQLNSKMQLINQITLLYHCINLNLPYRWLHKTKFIGLPACSWNLACGSRLRNKCVLGNSHFCSHDTAIQIPSPICRRIGSQWQYNAHDYPRIPGARRYICIEKFGCRFFFNRLPRGYSLVYIKYAGIAFTDVTKDCREDSTQSKIVIVRYKRPCGFYAEGA